MLYCAGKFFRSGDGASMRRRYQVGSVEKRGKKQPVWVGRYWEPVLRDGKFSKTYRREILGACTAISRSRAQRALADILRPINEGLHAPVSASTFGEFCAKWQADALVNYRESTRGFYLRTAERWIIPYFKAWPLEDVTPLAVQQFINNFSGYSRSVLKHLRTTLGCIFTSAVDWRYVGSNPAGRLKLPRGKDVQQAQVLTVAELQKIMAALAEPYKTMAVLLAHLAVRESEVMALRWADFDLARRVLTVQRSEYRGAVDETKTKRGRRELPYGEAVAQALLSLEAHIRASGSSLGAYLFVAPKGGFYSPQRITQKVFRPLARGLGVPAFTWRSFRRSAATALQLAGVDIAVVQQVLGHSEPGMSLHYMDDLKIRRAAMAQLDALLAAQAGAEGPFLLDPNRPKSVLM